MNAFARVALAVVLLGSLGWLFRLVRQRRLRGKYVLPWLFAVPVLTVLALFPSLLERLADLLGIDYPLAAFLLLGLAFALVLLVHASWELSRLEERTRRLAEEVAIARALVDQQGTGRSPYRAHEAEAESDGRGRPAS
ncbi:MAG: DUF2304 domain-containing protein [Acidimicrobiia bacterium]